ncbi:MFS transporter [Kribbella sp. NBC_00709]|uniref:MFS transporter n=1 Tax=Kribbella sp. NBC_00709 TaxID=2975972 RepID=UPI002E2B9BB9|nr:MFS transporter [Kribbella sp. NBC_00709]
MSSLCDSSSRNSRLDVGPPAQVRRRGSLLPLLALDLGICMLVASEFLPASVLPGMAADLGVSEGTAGLAVAATAVAGAVTAPSIAVVLPRADRRLVLLGLLLAATIADLAVALAPGFAVMLVGRLLLGVAIAGYWSFAFGAGIQALPGRERLVSTSLSVGVSVATIIAVPLASIGADRAGWRPVFGVAAALTAVSLVLLALVFPPVPAHPSAGLAMMRSALRNPLLIAGLVFIVVAVFGNFVAYPYIRLAIMRVAPDGSAWLLLAWGLGGLLGNLAAGALAKRLTLATAVAPILLSGSLAVTAYAVGVPMLAVGIVVWGLAFSMMPVTTQLWVARAEREHTESAMSLQVAAFQTAITVGSAVGGAVVDGHGVSAALVLGAAVAVVSGVGFAVLRTPRT